MSWIRATLALLLLMQYSVSPTVQQGVKPCNQYADIAFVVDVSGSIEGDGEHPGYFDQYVKTFLKNLAEKLQVGPGKNHIGVAIFGNAGKLEFTLKSDINDVLAGIDHIAYPSNGENTNTSGGINIMRNQILCKGCPGYRDEAAHVCMVITDGYSTHDHELTVPSADAAKNEGITMFSLGVTLKVQVKELVDIASQTPNYNFAPDVAEAKGTGAFMSKGFVSYVPTIEELNSFVAQLVDFLSKATCT